MVIDDNILIFHYFGEKKEQGELFGETVSAVFEVDFFKGSQGRFSIEIG